MRIYTNQLAQHLSKLVPVYVVLGDEPLQKAQTLDTLRATCLKQGFDERICLSQEQSFNWQQLETAGQNLSLFSQKQLIELELSNLKIGQEGSKTLVSFLAQQSPDSILIIHGPKAPAETQKAKWFKQLEQAGLYIVVNQPEGRHFQQTIERQAKVRGLNFESEALTKFCLMFEGNLLAADQELEKLSLQIGHYVIDSKVLKQRVTNQAQYNLFELQDCFLAGHTEKALTILARLREQEMEPQLLFWAFSRELNLLLSLNESKLRGQPTHKIYQQARVWQSRQQLFEQALQRLDLATLLQCQSLLASVEQQIKHEFNTPWHLFSELLIKLTVNHKD
ncbi:DNA polymerase III subunit delta [Alteromonadales bacterium alter-6D02]|nr:DNA polymerase III subunit delta [Alteromonadales bacterium alter-6D02]